MSFVVLQKKKPKLYWTFKVVYMLRTPLLLSTKAINT